MQLQSVCMLLLSVVDSTHDLSFVFFTTLSPQCYKDSLINSNEFQAEWVLPLDGGQCWLKHVLPVMYCWWLCPFKHKKVCLCYFRQTAHCEEKMEATASPRRPLHEKYITTASWYSDICLFFNFIFENIPILAHVYLHLKLYFSNLLFKSFLFVGI